jgi:hypothetical protein
MEINRQSQSLHIPTGGSVDWVLKQHVERDICLAYRQLADYSWIMGDLYWGTVFDLPYWEYLDWADLDGDDRAFIRDGCLVMLLAAAWARIDGANWWIAEHLPACQKAVERLRPEASDAMELVRIVGLVLAAATAGPSEQPELAALSKWAHVRYVRGYFERQAETFRTNPYYGSPGAG